MILISKAYYQKLTPEENKRGGKASMEKILFFGAR